MRRRRLGGGLRCRGSLGEGGARGQRRVLTCRVGYRRCRGGERVGNGLKFGEERFVEKGTVEDVG